MFDSCVHLFNYWGERDEDGRRFIRCRTRNVPASTTQTQAFSSTPSYIVTLMENVPSALWLIPGSKVHPTFSSVIRELSVKFGGPVFTPHVTLLSQISGATRPVLELSAQLAGVIPPFEVRFSRVTHSSEHLRAVFLELPRSPELIEARRLAERLFPNVAASHFSPHISLAYGSIDRAQAESEFESILAQIPRRFVLGALELVRASSGSSVEAWRRLRTSPLGGNRP
jgi:2'-5' RNA ligase